MTRTIVFGPMIVIAIVTLGLADAASKKEIAAAPAWVRPLYCRDLVTPDAKEIFASERLRGWFEGMMAPVAERLDLQRQKDMDDLYALLLTYCSKDQGTGVIDAVIGVREAIEGLMPSTGPPASGR
jgi:hypothetical protein